MLARLHASDVLLDRDLDGADGDRRAGPPVPRRVGAGGCRPRRTPSSRRTGTCIPARSWSAAGAVRLIDFDEATMAPAGLDVGNFLAHLTKDVVQGRRPVTEAEPAGAAFLRGYGRIPRDLPWWRRIALTRLACRAEERRGRPAEAASLRALAG